tara:strand:+ start:150 stop:1376 length:1227 start_codon:yes stop_codon:yes gene_type:complete
MEFLNSIYRELFFNFNSSLVLTIQSKTLAITNRILQLFIFGILIYDLVVNELYLKTEIPSGYTTMWAEKGNLYELQKKNHYNYCDNTTYNYIWDSPDWEYTNISCTNLHYSESYIKGEKEIFFMTYYSDKNTFINKTCNKNFKLVDTINNNSICEKNDNYFTTGIEGMILAFDHFFTTSFVSGGNIDSSGIKVKTRIRDCNDKYDAYVFNPQETIKMNISEWLKLGCVSLDNYNTGTVTSLSDPRVTNINYPFNRITGIDIIFKVNYYNLKSVTGYTSEECIINVMANNGWASKGSHLNYFKYPQKKDNYHFIDRYKYGVKFKFIVSGLMGKFNMYYLINHFVSGVVLIGVTTKLISILATLYFKNYSNLTRITKKIEDRNNIQENQDVNQNNNNLNRRHNYMNETTI